MLIRDSLVWFETCPSLRWSIFGCHFQINLAIGSDIEGSRALESAHAEDHECQANVYLHSWLLNYTRLLKLALASLFCNKVCDASEGHKFCASGWDRRD